MVFRRYTECQSDALTLTSSGCWSLEPPCRDYYRSATPTHRYPPSTLSMRHWSASSTPTSNGPSSASAAYAVPQGGPQPDYRAAQPSGGRGDGTKLPFGSSFRRVIRRGH